MRTEMERLEAEKIPHTTPSIAGSNQPGRPVNPVHGTRSPMPANPTTTPTVHGPTPISAQNRNADPATGMFAPASGGHPARFPANKNKVYAPARYSGGTVPPCQPGIFLPHGVVDD